MLLNFTFSLLFIFALQVPTPDIPPLPTNLEQISVTNVQEMTPLVSFDDPNIQQTVISPDATLIAIASQYIDNDYLITIHRIDNGEPVANIGGRMDLFDTMAWSPDSTQLAVASGYLSGSTELLNVRTYTIARGSGNEYVMGNSDTWFSYFFETYPLFLQGDDSGLSLVREIDISWSPTGDLLAISFIDQFALIDVTGNIEVFSTVLQNVSRIDIQWSSDGRYLVTSPDVGAIQLWGLPE